MSSILTAAKEFFRLLGGVQGADIQEAFELHTSVIEQMNAIAPNRAQQAIENVEKSRELIRRSDELLKEKWVIEKHGKPYWMIYPGSAEQCRESYVRESEIRKSLSDCNHYLEQQHMVTLGIASAQAKEIKKKCANLQQEREEKQKELDEKCAENQEIKKKNNKLEADLTTTNEENKSSKAEAKKYKKLLKQTLEEKNQLIQIVQQLKQDHEDQIQKSEKLLRGLEDAKNALEKSDLSCEEQKKRRKELNEQIVEQKLRIKELESKKNRTNIEKQRRCSLKTILVSSACFAMLGFLWMNPDLKLNLI